MCTRKCLDARSLSCNVTFLDQVPYCEDHFNLYLLFSKAAVMLPVSRWHFEKHLRVLIMTYQEVVKTGTPFCDHHKQKILVPSILQNYKKRIVPPRARLTSNSPIPREEHRVWRISICLWKRSSRMRRYLNFLIRTFGMGIHNIFYDKVKFRNKLCAAVVNVLVVTVLYTYM